MTSDDVTLLLDMKSELKHLWFRTKDKVKEWTQKDPLMIAPYLSYSNSHEAIIRGRVLENEGIVVREDDGRWNNFVNNIKRMESDEAKETKVQVEFQNNTYNCTTDDEGYFKIKIPLINTEQATDEIGYLTAKLSLPDHQHDNEPSSTPVNIMLAHPKTQYAIITDVDDTILESHVDSFLKLRLLYETFFKNAHTRKAFDHIADVLRTITQNKSGQPIQPIFYLSHSPWNLYELLQQFLKNNNIPKGPFFLRDFGYKRGEEKFEYENHKQLTIEHLFEFYPEIPFVLIGDATEHDVDIYATVFKNHPSRIKQIIIRATEKEKRNDHVREVIAQNPEAPIQLISHSDEILNLFKKLP